MSGDIGEFGDSEETGSGGGGVAFFGLEVDDIIARWRYRSMNRTSFEILEPRKTVGDLVSGIHIYRCC